MNTRRKKKLPALDKYVIFSLIMLILFTIVTIVYQFMQEDSMSDTLITCFFACFGGELFFCAMIKKLKLKRGDTDNEMDR